MDPLIILAIGIASVLGLILIFRVHAFLALIISAMLVSLLAPGPMETKVQRVAEAFGGAAGNIGIVIGLAAIIGECMLVSGAADRVVQAFLAVCGEKRASWALMGSGYVLAIPVFFDTVFYLLIPLARSLFKRTNSHYLLYIMAIAAGGAITHTLVPPTPGPLVMASTLGIDLGVLIFVGALVAFPAAVVGLAFSRWLDARLPVPFREDNVIGNADDDPNVPAKTPSLLMSLLPVLLPVLMISANTLLSTLADNEHASRLRAEEIRHWNFLADNTESSAPVIERILSLLPDEIRSNAANSNLTSEEQAEFQTALLESLNQLLLQKSPTFYDADAFDGLIPERKTLEDSLRSDDLTKEERYQTERLLLLKSLQKKGVASMSNAERERFNRLLLEAAFPDAIAPHVWETPLRKAANLSALIGNPNLALLLSTFVALGLVCSVKGYTFRQLTQIVEASLMSGGTIILITAGGGAFGAMLKVAGIGDAISSRFAGGDGASGLMFLVLGYGVAALMKVAQGSSTVAMITVSGMLAAMISQVSLGFHPAYLATSIGAGSLMGSWMNDSGFWIFAKMGRLTEAETLRSWTLLLAVMSAVGFAVTLLLAVFLPLA